MIDTSLIAKELGKSFDGKSILSNVSFQLKKGELLLVLGDNGAGKTTLLKVLAGIYTADSGELQMSGALSYYGTDLYLYGPMTVAENLEYFATLYGISGKKIDSLVERWELSQILKAQVRTLSSGQKCRVSIARSCLAESEIYLFDEPLRMLDERGKETFIEQLKVLTKKASVVLTTHEPERFNNAFYDASCLELR